jgi:DNA repair photolyase
MISNVCSMNERPFPHGVTAVEIEAKSVLNRVRGMPFEWSINPYRGCAHGCVFCYARRTHEFLEQDGIDRWGNTIFVKTNAAAVLRRELARPAWRGDPVTIGTATDPYQPLEGTYRITRAILGELVRARTPAHLITRSPLIVRDVDVLAELGERASVSIGISLPTLDAELARRIEPTVAPPARRLFAVQSLAARGIRVGVAVAPILPGLTDDHKTIADVVRAARDCGAGFVWHNVLNLGEVTRDAYFAFLRESEPQLVGLYEALYRGKYAPKAYTSAIGERFAQEKRRYPLGERPLREPRSNGIQLSLI